MYDPTFNQHTLDHQIRSADFKSRPELQQPVERERLVRRAVRQASSGLSTMQVTSSMIGGRCIYTATDLADELVLRKAQQNLRQLTNVKQTNRANIVLSVRRLCEEGVPFTLVKADIKSFYESVNTNLIRKKLLADIPNSIGTLHVLEMFFDALTLRNIRGLPRGMAISSILSEYILRDFDRDILSRSDSFYYCRFVDDMLFVLDSDVDSKSYINCVGGSLPPGLELSYSKTKIIKFDKFDKSNKEKYLENSFSFLGFKFDVDFIKRDQSFNTLSRAVTVDISQNKVKKIKTKIMRSVEEYLRNRDFRDFEDRIKIITANYTFFDRKDRVYRKAGVYYGYNLIDLPAASLQELDSFLKKVILAKDGRTFSKLHPALSSSQRRRLMKYSFVRSFNEKHLFSFNANRTAELSRCWTYG